MCKKRPFSVLVVNVGIPTQFSMASIAGIYGGFGAGGDDGSGGRGNLFSRFQKDIIKEQAANAQARRDELA